MAITPSTDISPAPAVKGGRYSVLPRLAGTGYIPLGLFARVPLAMQTIGVLTMVTGVSASYAVGGFAAGCVGVGAAVGAPVIGFLADRLGQKRVLLVLAVVNALLLAAVVLLSYTHIYCYSRDKLSGEPARKTLIAARQCEAICFKGSRLVFANEQRDVYAVNGFLQTKYESMLPALGKAVLPVVKDAFEIDGTGEAWSNYRSEIALAGRGQDEHLGWLLAGDRLLLKGKLRYHGDFQSSRLVSSSLGSAVLLSFGAERRLNVAAQDVQIAIGDNGERGLEAWRMDLTGERIKLSRLQECQLKGSVKKGVLEFEASIAAGQVWGEKIPESFLFNAMTWKLRGERELQFSGEDIYSLFRPYLWGDVNLRRQ